MIQTETYESQKLERLQSFRHCFRSAHKTEKFFPALFIAFKESRFNKAYIKTSLQSPKTLCTDLKIRRLLLRRKDLTSDQIKEILNQHITLFAIHEINHLIHQYTSLPDSHPKKTDGLALLQRRLATRTAHIKPLPAGIPQNIITAYNTLRTPS